MAEKKDNSRLVFARLKNLAISPRKTRLVVDLIRPLTIPVALNVLENLSKRSATAILNLLNSAIANATNNFEYNFNTLEIAEIYVNEGRKLKRFRPRAKGSTAPVWKRASHVCIVLASSASSPHVDKSSSAVSSPSENAKVTEAVVKERK